MKKVSLARALHLADEAAEELVRAAMKHGSFNSAHEGYAVLLEEVDELWEEVKKGGSQPRSVEKMRTEAVQIAAMALRFINDVCDDACPRERSERVPFTEPTLTPEDPEATR